MRDIKKHIIHCSASEIGDVPTIRKWHKARGWRDVGYHFVIRRDGEIEVGRQLSEIGAHTRGQNRNSIGTCLIGNTHFTDAQFDALVRLHKSLKQVFPGLEAFGHRAFTRYKTCPNFDVGDVLGRG